ncbi:MAG TPA: universal stress protein [Saprospiraceae bacterium]|nr:universal stress protein [Saprospiraceae bacterium]
MIETKYSPVDYETSEFAIRRALIALEVGATDRSILQYLNFFIKLAPVERLSFLHVLPMPDFWESLEKEAIHLVQDNTAQAKALQDLKLRTLAQLELRENIKTDFGIRQGSPLDELLEEAITLDADLIVTGLSTKRGAHGILAKTLARHATCNTLVIPDLAKPSLTNILVPVDFSANSAKALHMAVELNMQLTLPAKITCVYVYDVPDMGWYKIQRSEGEMRTMIETNRRDAFETFLHLHVPAYHDAIETLLVPRVRSSIGTHIMETVDETFADLVIMGAKGYSQVARLLLGSVTEKVLALTTHVPVLVVK